MVPSMKGRAIGITSQAMTTSPSETIAPARVPGTDMLPNVLRDAGRCLSAHRGVKVTSLLDPLVLSSLQIVVPLQDMSHACTSLLKNHVVIRTLRNLDSLPKVAHRSPYWHSAELLHFIAPDSQCNTFNTY
jgi:hypothetical protein